MWMKCFLDDKEDTSPKPFIQNPTPHHLSPAMAKMGAQDFDELILWEEPLKIERMSTYTLNQKLSLMATGPIFFLSSIKKMNTSCFDKRWSDMIKGYYQLPLCLTGL